MRYHTVILYIVDTMQWLVLHWLRSSVRQKCFGQKEVQYWLYWRPLSWQWTTVEQLPQPGSHSEICRPKRGTVLSWQWTTVEQLPQPGSHSEICRPKRGTVQSTVPLCSLSPSVINVAAKKRCNTDCTSIMAMDNGWTAPSVLQWNQRYFGLKEVQYSSAALTVYPYASNRVFAENLVGLGFLYSISYIKSLHPQKNIYCGKKVAQMPLFTYFFLGWVGLGLGNSSVL